MFRISQLGLFLYYIKILKLYENIILSIFKRFRLLCLHIISIKKIIYLHDVHSQGKKMVWANILFIE